MNRTWFVDGKELRKDELAAHYSNNLKSEQEETKIAPFLNINKQLTITEIANYYDSNYDFIYRIIGKPTYNRFISSKKIKPIYLNFTAKFKLMLEKDMLEKKKNVI